MLEPRIEVNHQILKDNLKKIRTRLEQTVKVMAVVKSNAYGHGICEISKTLEPLVDMFGVGYLEEGVKLRQCIKQDILIMGPVYDFGVAVDSNCIIALESIHQFNAMVQYYEKFMKGTDQVLRVHIKVDTGMHRFGVSYAELVDMVSIFDNRHCEENIRIEGLFSHFASTVNQNEKLVEGQFEQFQKAKRFMKNHFDGDLIYHIANSENALDTSRYQENMVRIGNGLYGGMYLKKPLETKRIGRILLPIMSIHTLQNNSRFGYGFKAKGRAGTRLGAVKTGFYEGMAMYKLPVGVGFFHKVKALARRVLKAFLKKEYVRYDKLTLPVVGMVNMQFFQIDLTGTEIMAGDFVELPKEPLFYDDSVKRVHLMEADNETDY